MRALAHTDPLTGLPNRRSLSDALAQALLGASTDRMLTVYLIDVDEFKPVNDTYGHDAGDALWVEISRRLQANVCSGDIVARLGGDEFVVLAPLAQRCASKRSWQPVAGALRRAAHDIATRSSYQAHHRLCHGPD